MKKYSLILNKFLFIVAFLLANISFSHAKSNMKLHGILLVPPPCELQDGGIIDVPFGKNVGIHKVDGINYTQDINYKLVCKKNEKGWDLGLTLLGPASSFDEAALQTNFKDLAIRITQNGQPFKLNERLAISVDNPPVLKAVLVKLPGSTLPEGAFEVSATLLAEYQ